MQVLSNGWHVPDEDEKMFNHVKGDKTKNSPNYEKRQRLVIEQEHPNKKTFLDVGANIGVWSLAMEKQFDNVIAFEPSTKNLECLRLIWDGEIRINHFTLWKVYVTRGILYFSGHIILNFV